MKYIVEMKETSYGSVEVDAISREEAEAMASRLYLEGKVHWADSELDLLARENWRSMEVER